MGGPYDLEELNRCFVKAYWFVCMASNADLLWSIGISVDYMLLWVDICIAAVCILMVVCKLTGIVARDLLVYEVPGGTSWHHETVVE